jgi:hypothetical protein
MDICAHCGCVAEWWWLGVQVRSLLGVREVVSWGVLVDIEKNKNTTYFFIIVF